MTEDDGSSSDEEIEELREEIDEIQARVSEIGQRLDSLAEDRSEGENDSASEQTESDKPWMSMDDTEGSGGGDTLNGRFDVDWEEFLGIKLFGYLGGIALIIGTLFVIRLAISEGLIGPLGRVILAVSAGALVVGGGQYAHYRMSVTPWEYIALATGYTIMFVALYGSYGSTFYRQALGMPFWLMLVLVSVVAAVALADTVVNGYRRLSSVSMLLVWGAVLITLGEGDILPTAYLSVVLLILAGVTYWRSWKLPLIVSILPAYSSTWVVIADFVDSAMPILAGLLVLYVLFLSITELARRSDDPQATFTVTNLVIPLLHVSTAVVSLGLIGSRVEETIIGGTFLLVAVGLAGVVAYTTRRSVSGSVVGEPFIAFAVTGVGLTLIADGAVRVVGLGLGVLLVILTSSYYKTDWPSTAAHATLVALAFDAARLSLYDVDVPVFPGGEYIARAVSVTVPLLLSYGMFWIAYDRSLLPSYSTAFITPQQVQRLHSWLGVVLLVVLVDALLTGVLLSIGWAVVGLALILAGSRLSVSQFRLQGITALGLTVGKVFIVDTSGLDPIPRIISFVVLGVILLVTSYFYAKRRSDLSVPSLGDDEE